MIQTGQTFEKEFQFTQEQVNKFIEITGDDNPIHFDEAYAAGTMFKRPIMHGFLSASIFSRIFGTMFPGDGTIYMSQLMNFHKPMYVDQLYKAQMEVAEVLEGKHKARVNTRVTDAQGEETISGEAWVYHRKLIP